MTSIHQLALLSAKKKRPIKVNKQRQFNGWQSANEYVELQEYANKFVNKRNKQ